MSLFALFVLIFIPLVGSPQSSSSGAVAKAQAHSTAGEHEKAIAILEPYVEKNTTDSAAWALLANSWHAKGEFARALELHSKVASFPATRAMGSYNMACANAQLGNQDAAFECMERARMAGFYNLKLLQNDAALASLRGDERFAKFLTLKDLPVSFLEEVEPIFVINGEAAGDQFGWIGRNAGDCDKDGVADMLISAPYKSLGGRNAGRIYVYSGKTGEELFRCSGQPGDLLGVAIESAGDVNNDGHADVIAGGSSSGGMGRAFVFSGDKGDTLHTLQGEAAGDRFGGAVAGAGDVDGDGFSDVAVGATGFDGVGADSGRAYLFSGKTGKRLLSLDGEAVGHRFGSTVDAHTDENGTLLIVGAMNAGAGQCGRVYVYRVVNNRAELAFKIEGQAGDINLGRMFVSALGDVNGDGHVDVYASDWESNANGILGSGRIYIHSGKDGQRLYELAGKIPGEGFGIGTCEAGDVDRDGCDDFLVGIWQSSAGANSSGKCTLFSGKSGAVLANYTSLSPQDTFGFDTTGLGDVNGDGVLDFLITAASSHVSGPRSGRVFVISAPPLE